MTTNHTTTLTAGTTATGQAPVHRTYFGVPLDTLGPNRTGLLRALVPVLFALALGAGLLVQAVTR